MTEGPPEEGEEEEGEEEEEEENVAWGRWGCWCVSESNIDCTLVSHTECPQACSLQQKKKLILPTLPLFTTDSHHVYFLSQ